MKSSAVISTNGSYRYALYRDWGPGPNVAFVMLNPSSADAEVDDPTVRRCIGFAEREGMGSLTVINLYALRSTDPRYLAAHIDPVGPDNQYWWDKALGVADLIVAAWGVAGGWDVPVTTPICEAEMIGWSCLGLTKDGYPKHPLYVPASAPLIPFP